MLHLLLVAVGVSATALNDIAHALPWRSMVDATVLQFGCHDPSLWTAKGVVQRVVVVPVREEPCPHGVLWAPGEGLPAGEVVVQAVGSRVSAANFSRQVVQLEDALGGVDVVSLFGVHGAGVQHADGVLASGLRAASVATLVGGNASWLPSSMPDCMGTGELQAWIERVGVRAAGLLVGDPCAAVVVLASDNPRLKRLALYTAARTADPAALLSEEKWQLLERLHTTPVAGLNLASHVRRSAAIRSPDGVDDLHPSPGCHLAWTVLIVGFNNEPFIFNQTAWSLVYGLRQLGFHADVQVCLGIDEDSGCNRQAFAGRQLVVLGANTLARSHIVHDDGSEHLAVLYPGLALLPEDAIMFQFEHISGDVGTTQWMTPDYLDLLKARPVWDYSWANAAKLLHHFGVAATVVPLGHSPAWAKLTTTEQPIQQDIDVLFGGVETEYRSVTLNALRGVAGLRLHAMNRVWGVELDKLMDRSKIVLSLRTWGLDGEWKLTRLAPLLASGRFVIMEVPSSTYASNSAERSDWAYFEGGVVFATADTIVDVILEWVQAPASARAAVAAKGHHLWLNRPQERVLYPAVHGLLSQRACV